MTIPNPIDPASLPTQTFDWGAIKWFVTPTNTPGAGLTFGEVVLVPGNGHARHNHPDAEEILSVLSDQGEQMVDDGQPFPVHAGDTIYNPGGPERALADLPDFRELAPGEFPTWTRR